jgi:iron-sulfur cluster insertion protein
MTSVDFNFKVTEDARKRIAYLISQEKSPNLKLRILVDSGGCSGLRYIYQLTDKVNQDDLVFESDDVQIVIDQISKTFLSGSTLDYVQNLGASFFQITNPNASIKCGCGSSFAV